jgi:hypothetical protein
MSTALEKPAMLAIIGTAGRDNTRPFTALLWESMCAHAADHVKTHGVDALVSGGAAWADHLAVHLFRTGAVRSLWLHLPAPMKDRQFMSGRYGSAGAAANYYHGRFGRVIGRRTVEDIVESMEQPGCEFTMQPFSYGYRAMFARNKLIAADASSVLAYTWGDGDAPADGGTRNTWDQCMTRQKWHVPLATLAH